MKDCFNYSKNYEDITNGWFYLQHRKQDKAVKKPKECVALTVLFKPLFIYFKHYAVTFAYLPCLFTTKL